MNVILDPQFPPELVGHLQVGNLHLSPFSPGSGSTSEEGTPWKTLLQCTLLYPGEKSGFAVQGQWCFFFYRQWFYSLSFLGNKKFLKDQNFREKSLKIFIQQEKQY